MYRALAAILASLAFNLSGTAKCAGPVPVILDTDIGHDADDVRALGRKGTGR